MALRQIIFRGKRLDNGEWVYGDLENCKIRQKSFIHTYTDDGKYHCQFEVDPDTVGQYTGRTDVDDDKIFEGDVLTVTIFDHNGLDTMHTVVVKWDEEYAQFMCVDVNDENCMWVLGWIILNDGEPLIIGNRWDNLSLLKGGEK